MDSVQLSQGGYKATTRRQFTFYHSLGVPRTHLINLGQMKSWFDERMKVSGLEPGPPELEIHHSNH